jgi:SSS family solute:Na+ symporter
MSSIDWIVLLLTQFFIIGYGIWRSRDSNKDIKTYLLGNNKMGWVTIGISVIATQASAITFLSIPGQAFYDGMGFIQIYFGLPIAMVILCITAIPIYQKLGVYTAYEYLETRFDLKIRALAAFLFLIQRGLSTGITIYAPSLVLATVLGWDINWTVILTGTVVTCYTFFGGTKAVSFTQLQQTLVIWIGMFAAVYILITNLPVNLSFSDIIHVAGNMGKMELVDLSFDPSDRYTLWSGLIGGIFLSLSYFGTDQSQVQRYLGGETVTESRLGLLMSAIVKIPMQFFILSLGVLLFVFYQFAPQPVFFNANEVKKVYNSPEKADFQAVENKFKAISQQKQVAIRAYLELRKDEENKLTEMLAAMTMIQQLDAESKLLHKQAGEIIQQSNKNVNKKVDTKDADYVFISFITNYLPIGLIGLLISVMISASMSSAASALNALASTTIIDIYKRLIKTDESPEHYLKISKNLTLFWGFICVLFAIFVSRLDNMIQAVNILGSLFYGTVLGIFLVAFYMKKIGGLAVFAAAIISEAIILTCFTFFRDEIAYLWYNVIGCVLVMFFAYIFTMFMTKKEVAV